MVILSMTLTTLTVASIAIAVLAVILAIPLSVVANLLTPRIQNRLANRSRRAAISRIQHLRAELIDRETLVSSPTKLFAEAAHQSSLGIAFVLIAMPALLGTFALVFLEPRRKLDVVFHQVGPAVSSLLVIVVVFRFVRKAQRFRDCVDFDKYKTRQLDAIAKLKQEWDS